MRRSPFQIWTVVCAFAVVGLFAGLLGALSLFGSWTTISAHYQKTAVYDDMTFKVGSDTGNYVSFSTAQTEGPIARVYVRTKGGNMAYFLPTLTEKDMKEFWPTADTKDIAGEKWYTRGGHFKFSNGVFTGCFLTQAGDTEIGASKDGIFISLPAKPADVHRIFGKPRRYGRVRLPAT